MNKKLMFFISSAVACNGLAMKESVINNGSKKPSAHLETINEKNGNPFSGIINAFINAKSECKEGEKKLKNASIDLCKQTKEHLLTLISTAVKLMSTEEKEITLRMISEVHAVAIDLKNVIELMIEPGRSQCEKDILLQGFYQRATSALGIYGLLLAKTYAEEHPEFNAELETIAGKVAVSGKAVFLDMLDTISKAENIAKQTQK